MKQSSQRDAFFTDLPIHSHTCEFCPRGWLCLKSRCPEPKRSVCLDCKKWAEKAIEK